MVVNVMALNRNGFRDWLVQRVSAVLLAAYALFMLGYFLCHRDLEFGQWQALFAHPFMRIFTFATLVAIVLHAWIGMWMVYTDYIKPTWIRFIVQTLTIVLFLFYLGWGFEILWGMG